MILSSLHKEARIILSDIHSIGVLLILPIAFMLIMTFAMSEQHTDVIKKTTVSFLSDNSDDISSAYQGYIKQQGFSIVAADQKSDISIRLPETFNEKILLGLAKGSIEVNLHSGITPQKKLAVINLIHTALSKAKLHAFMLESGDLDEDMHLDEQITAIGNSTEVASYFNINTTSQQATTPILYSVPSWIVFGLYFIVLPVSITVINEKQNGTLIRLKTFPISTSQYFMSKFGAFYILSIFQLILLSLVGVFIVPIVTEQPEIIINNWAIYFISALFILLAANAFAFFIAALVSSYEQAIVFGGGINILLAAISGFMVPIDILPEVMAEVATYSPLYWSAEIIRAMFTGSSLSYVLPYLFKLLAFSALVLSAGFYLFINKIRKLTWN